MDQVTPDAAPARPLSGPRIPPSSGRPARHLVVFLHGWGSSGDDLIQLGPMFARTLPDAEFVSPHGPEPCDQNPAGYQWFSLADSGTARAAAAARAAADIGTFIDGELQRLELPDNAVVLVGFSQGTMMALEVGLRRPIAGVLGYSGALLPSDREPATTDICLIHGALDEVLPLEQMFSAVAGLASLGARVRYHVRSRLGHSIDEEGIAVGSDFLRRQLLA